MDNYRIGVVGCAGRMGRMLLRVLAETKGFFARVKEFWEDLTESRGRGA